MSIPYNLRRPIGIDYYADLDYFWAAKKNMHLAGYHCSPPSGMAPLLDHYLINSIKRFQEYNSLQVDGTMMPCGETERRIHRKGDVA